MQSNYSFMNSIYKKKIRFRSYIVQPSFFKKLATIPFVSEFAWVHFCCLKFAVVYYLNKYVLKCPKRTIVVQMSLFSVYNPLWSNFPILFVARSSAYPTMYVLNIVYLFTFYNLVKLQYIFFYFFFLLKEKIESELRLFFCHVMQPVINFGRMITFSSLGS